MDTDATHPTSRPLAPPEPPEPPEPPPPTAPAPSVPIHPIGATRLADLLGEALDHHDRIADLLRRLDRCGPLDDGVVLRLAGQTEGVLALIVEHIHHHVPDADQLTMSPLQLQVARDDARRFGARDRWTALDEENAELRAALRDLGDAARRAARRPDPDR